MTNIKVDYTSEDRTSEDEDTTTFTAEIHIKLFQAIFKDFYHINVNAWAIFQTADNCSINKKVAKLTNIPHILFANHLLNSEIQYMISNTPVLAEVLDIVHHIMASVKSSIKNSSVLQTLINLKPEVRNTTRWTG